MRPIVLQDSVGVAPTRLLREARQRVCFGNGHVQEIDEDSWLLRLSTVLKLRLHARAGGVVRVYLDRAYVAHSA